MALYLVWILLGFSLGVPPIDLDIEAFGRENYDDSDTWELHYNYDDEEEEVSFHERIHFVSMSIYHHT